MSKYLQIIKQICDEQKINMTLLSKDYVIMLERNNVIRFITGYKFGSNDHAIGNILDDKYATYDVLKKLNIPVCEHKIFYNVNNKNPYALGCNSFDSIKEYFYAHKENIVIKSNTGTCGTNVYNITSLEDLKDKVEKLFTHNFSISVCPYYDITTEYRTIVLDGEIELLYGKVKPIVVGDGKKSIKKLLEEFNINYFKDNEKLLKEEYDRVLKHGEIYEYNWKFNLSQGANITLDIDEALRERICSIVKDIVSKLQFKFCSIDIILTESGELRVLEINSGVMMENFMSLCLEGRNIAKEIYTKAILKLFE